MFPDVPGNTGPSLIVNRLHVEVNYGCVFANTGRVEEITDSIYRRLATDNDLIGVRYHPESWIVCDQALGTEGKSIGELQAEEVVSEKRIRRQKAYLSTVAFRPASASFSLTTAPHASKKNDENFIAVM